MLLLAYHHYNYEHYYFNSTRRNTSRYSNSNYNNYYNNDNDNNNVYQPTLYLYFKQYIYHFITYNQIELITIVFLYII